MADSPGVIKNTPVFFFLRSGIIIFRVLSGMMLRHSHNPSFQQLPALTLYVSQITEFQPPTLHLYCTK